jgi:Cu/Ag efflux protein CusF
MEGTVKVKLHAWTRLVLSIAFFFGLSMAVTGHLGAQTRLEGDGRVIKVDEAEHMLFLAHGPIPGFMPAPMRHGFAVHRDELLKGLKVGDMIHFVLEVQNDILGISSIEHIGDRQ